jgi:hypothetical protein
MVSTFREAAPDAWERLLEIADPRGARAHGAQPFAARSPTAGRCRAPSCS